MPSQPPPSAQPPFSDRHPEDAIESAPRPEGERIAKLLARAGVASRREIERMIADGRVALDGAVLDTAATILPNLRGVTVDNNPVAAAEATRLFAFHKPTGLITAERDMAGRPTIYTALRNALPKGTPRLMPVGRLDLGTEGLLLMTNDGGLKRTMELPATKVPRTYRARAFGVVTQAQLEDLIEGVEIDGMRYGSINANLERGTGRNVWVELTITEGKNREVRRVLEYLGLKVNRLIRTGYGPFNLGDLPRGQAVELTGKPVARFLSEMTGAPIPRGGVKKAEREMIPVVAPRRGPSPAPSAPRRGPAKPLHGPGQTAPAKTAAAKPAYAKQAPAFGRPTFAKPATGQGKSAQAKPAAGFGKPARAAAPGAGPAHSQDAPTKSGHAKPRFPKTVFSKPGSGSPRPARHETDGTDAPRKGPSSPTGKRPSGRKHPAPTRGNIPRGPRK